MIKKNGIEIPELEYLFNSGFFLNAYTGSKNGFNYKIIPHKENGIDVYIWEGKFCLDKSEVKSKTNFALTVDGHKKMVEFIINELDKFENS